MSVLVYSCLYMQELQVDLEFFTVQEFCSKMKISREQAYNWIKSGRIKALRLEDNPKSPWRIPSSELERLQCSCYPEE